MICTGIYACLFMYCGKLASFIQHFAVFVENSEKPNYGSWKLLLARGFDYYFSIHSINLCY